MVTWPRKRITLSAIYGRLSVRAWALPGCMDIGLGCHLFGVLARRAPRAPDIVRTWVSHFAARDPPRTGQTVSSRPPTALAVVIVRLRPASSAAISAASKAGCAVRSQPACRTVAPLAVAPGQIPVQPRRIGPPAYQTDDRSLPWSRGLASARRRAQHFRFVRRWRRSGRGPFGTPAETKSMLKATSSPVSLRLPNDMTSAHRL